MEESLILIDRGSSKEWTPNGRVTGTRLKRGINVDNIVGGILLALAGFSLGFLTHRKSGLFWNFVNTRLLRKYLGDDGTTTILYIVSLVLIAVGTIVAIGLIN
ncbi:MAG: hypothetical protein GX971_11105 [Firmicutes bacterium]|nr:hypothetical protein [Bacillota bacterium]